MLWGCESIWDCTITDWNRDLASEDSQETPDAKEEETEGRVCNTDVCLKVFSKK